MKILLILCGLGGLAVLVLVLLVRSSLKEPLQDVPVAKRPWGAAAAVVRQMNHFELGKPGRTEYFLVAAATQTVARCPEAASAEPSHAVAREGGALRVELLPTLTGGRCGRRSFEGTTMPDDPRRLELELPDLEKAPARVIFAEGARRAEYLLRADADKVVFEKVSDPDGLLAPRFPAFKRLPRALYLAVGLDADNGALWGGNIAVEPAPGAGSPDRGDAVGGLVQYCRAPAPYLYAGGSAVIDGRETGYMQGVSEQTLDGLYGELAGAESAAGRKPAFTLYRLGLDGSLAKKP